MHRIIAFTLTFASLAVMATPAQVSAQAAYPASSPYPLISRLHADGPSAADPVYSSSLAPEAPHSDVPAPNARAKALAGIQPDLLRSTRNRFFRSLDLTANVGTSGIGFDLATPIAPHLKLRGGAQFYNQVVGFTTDGLNSSASISLRNVAIMADIFPFHNGFHLTPGLTLNNNDHISALLNVPGGQSFTLGNTDFTSSVTDPVSGSANVRFGNSVAPRLTVGWEDILHHKLGHVSLPAEFGFQLSSPPVVSLVLAGSACYQKDGCAPVASSTVVAAAQQEILKLQNDLHPLRFYPLSTIGIRYTIGH